MLHNPYHEEHKARRARLGIVEPKPVVKALAKVEKIIALPTPDKPPHISRDQYYITGEDNRVIDLPGNDFTWRDIIAEAAEKYGVSAREIIGPTQIHIVSVARQEVFYRLAKELGYGTSKIGRLIGDRDHATVYRGIQRHIARIATLTGHTEPWPFKFGAARKPHSVEDLKRVGDLKKRGKTYREIEEATGFTPSQAPSMYRRWLKIEKAMK